MCRTTVICVFSSRKYFQNISNTFLYFSLKYFKYIFLKYFKILFEIPVFVSLFEIYLLRISAHHWIKWSSSWNKLSRPAAKVIITRHASLVVPASIEQVYEFTTATLFVTGRRATASGGSSMRKYWRGQYVGLHKCDQIYERLSSSQSHGWCQLRRKTFVWRSDEWTVSDELYDNIES